MVSGFFNGDCLSQMKYLPNGSIDLICTDPPYPTTSRGNAGNSGGMLQRISIKEGKSLILTILIAQNTHQSFLGC